MSARGVGALTTAARKKRRRHPAECFIRTIFTFFNPALNFMTLFSRTCTGYNFFVISGFCSFFFEVARKSWNADKFMIYCSKIFAAFWYDKVNFCEVHENWECFCYLGAWFIFQWGFTNIYHLFCLYAIYKIKKKLFSKKTKVSLTIINLSTVNYLTISKKITHLFYFMF